MSEKHSDAEELQLCSELPADIRALYCISKADLEEKLMSDVF